MGYIGEEEELVEEEYEKVNPKEAPVREPSPEVVPAEPVEVPA